MNLIRNHKELEEYRDGLTNKSVGFVPTMGYLHKGHLHLVEASKKDNDITIVSIFVNPAQFSPDEDFTKYPRDEKRDLKLLKEMGVEVVFLPERQMLYNQDFDTWITIPKVSALYEGITRPHFFKGVLTVVLKLFHLVKPHLAYFGKKDYQQLFLMKKMVREFHLDVKIVDCPLIRESSGLALSSRNAYLSSEKRQVASHIYRTLIKIKELVIRKKCYDVGELTQIYLNEIALVTDMRVDYFNVVDKHTLLSQKKISESSVLLTAIIFEGIRLLDNLELYK